MDFVSDRPSRVQDETFEDEYGLDFDPSLFETGSMFPEAEESISLSYHVVSTLEIYNLDRLPAEPPIHLPLESEQSLAPNLDQLPAGSPAHLPPDSEQSLCEWGTLI